MSTQLNWNALPTEIQNLIFRHCFVGRRITVRRYFDPIPKNDVIAPLLTVSKQFSNPHQIVAIMLETVQVVIRVFHRLHQIVSSTPVSLLHKVRDLELGGEFNAELCIVYYTLDKIRSLFPGLKHLFMNSSRISDVFERQSLRQGRTQLQLYIQRGSTLYHCMKDSLCGKSHNLHTVKVKSIPVSHYNNARNTIAPLQPFDHSFDYANGHIDRAAAESMIADAAYKTDAQPPCFRMTAWQTALIAAAASTNFNLTLRLPIRLKGHANGHRRLTLFTECIFRVTDMCVRFAIQEFEVCIPQVLPRDFARDAKRFGAQKFDQADEIDMEDEEDCNWSTEVNLLAVGCDENIHETGKCQTLHSG